MERFLGQARSGRARRTPRTTARMSASEPSSPAARACTSTLPSAVASTGPASTSRPVTSAVSWHSSSLRAPPPITWIVRTSRPDAASSRSSTTLVLVRERDVDRAHGLAAADSSRPVDLGDQRGHVAAAQEALVVGIEDRTSPVDVAGRALQRREVRVPDARALLLEPQAHDVLEQPDRAVDAALVGQRVVAEHRAGQLEAEQRPGAATRGSRSARRAAARRRRPRRCRARRRCRRARRSRGGRARGRARARLDQRAERPRRQARAARSARSAHSPVRASSSPVVEAFVRSLASSPHSQYASRSGTSAIRVAPRATRSSASSW